jgi:hypothetical protein
MEYWSVEYLRRGVGVVEWWSDGSNTPVLHYSMSPLFFTSLEVLL